MSVVKSKNIVWIDVQKVICMMIVYFYHTEGRFGMNNEYFHSYFFPFYVNSFFFISGYLLFRSHASQDKVLLSSTEWYNASGKRMLMNIIFRIVIPTIFFSFIIFFPKCVLRGNGIQVSSLISATLLGGGFWFTSALAVAELIFFVLFVLKRSSFLLLTVMSLVIAFWGWMMPYEIEGGYIWEYQKAMTAVPYIMAGGWLYKYEPKVEKYLNSYWTAFVLIVIYVILVETYPTGNPIRKVFYYVMALTSIISLSVLCRKLPYSNLIRQIGSWTLGLYFFSGALPELFYILLFRKLAIPLHFGILLDATLSFFVATILVYGLNKYASFIFDISKLKN